MKDQADSLRKAIERIKHEKPNTTDLNSQFKKIQPAKVLTVTSGKGGVGKTNVSVNLAIALSQKGYRVVLIDADFGLANIEVLLGVTPKYTFLDMIRGEKSIREVICDAPNNVKLISGASGIEEMARLDAEKISLLTAEFLELDNEFDIIIIDTAAGISDSVIGMTMAADEVILVTTPEPTSITDAYALVKTLAQRDRSKIIQLIVNRAEDRNEAMNIISKLNQVALKFLDLELLKLGYILNDPLVTKSVKQQVPFVVGFPNSRVTANISEIADRLLEDKSIHDSAAGKGLSGFIHKISKLINLQF